jgi:hypothetical protein
MKSSKQYIGENSSVKNNYSPSWLALHKVNNQDLSKWGSITKTTKKKTLIQMYKGKNYFI